VGLILDDEKLRDERSSFSAKSYGFNDLEGRAFSVHKLLRTSSENDVDHAEAIEAGKYQGKEDRKKRQCQPDDDDDFARAIKPSKEEERRQRRELEEKNAASLFNDDSIQTM
jgi:epsin